MNSAYEINFDGLVGPTYSYNSFSWLNEDPLSKSQEASNPRLAFFDGLAKCKVLMDLGVKQAVLPPHERPHIPTLNRLGFTGTVENILNDVVRYAPWELRYTSSSSSMWAAHSASVTPSIDSILKKVQFTPANLQSQFHRSIEQETTASILKAIFSNPVFFEHHSALPAQDLFTDEGQAYQLRFAKNHSGPGIHLFTYGNTRIDESEYSSKFVTRQSKQASQSVKELHKIYEKQAVFAQLNPNAIDQHLFYNNQICFGNLNCFLYHEEAFFRTDVVIDELRKKLVDRADSDLNAIMIPTENLSLKEAFKSKIFTSQLVSLPDGTMHIIAPAECLEVKKAADFLDNLVTSSSNPIGEVHYIKLANIPNGGGPSSYTLKVNLNDTEFNEMNKGTLLTEELYKNLFAWGKKHYRDRLTPADLGDLSFFNENQAALDELTQILSLGSIYSFQKA